MKHPKAFFILFFLLPDLTMASQAIELHRQGSEIYHGDAECKSRYIQLFQELGLPDGLFTMKDVQEFGYNPSSGFIWFILKEKQSHSYKKIDRTVIFDKEVTAYVDNKKVKNISGVQTKALIFWITVVEIFADEFSPEMITFVSGIKGVSEKFPISAFELEEECDNLVYV